MLGNIIGGFIVILIGTTLAPVVATQVYQSVNMNNGTNGGWIPNGNFSAASVTVLGLTTLFYNLAIAASAIGITAQGLKNAGLM
jgi:hypothetical protein